MFAGIITAGVILLALSVIALFSIFKEMKKKRDENTMIENALKKDKDMKPRRYTYAEIKRITKNFKEKLPRTSLHKGKLGDGTPVVVKVLDASQQNVEEFIDEVEVIGRIQHPNILRLIGYSASAGKRALVYEFTQGETLEALIISSRNQNKTLEWMKIARGVANGIECAHQESPKKILDMFLNPQDILLDDTSIPKILVSATSDEGSRYVAPEAFSSSFSIIPEKAYAYGFGMLLLDMVGRNVDSFSSGLHFLEKREEGEIQIEEEGKGNGDLLKKLLIVGLWCMQWFPSDRPSMKAVMEMLHQESMPSLPPNPFDLTTQK